MVYLFGILGGIPEYGTILVRKRRPQEDHKSIFLCTRMELIGKNKFCLL